jgi:hypothetical protein
METAIITTPTSAFTPALSVSGGSNDPTQLASGTAGTQMLASGFNSLTAYNSSSQMLPASGSINCGFTGTQTFTWRPLNEPNVHMEIFPPALRPITLTTTYFAIRCALAKFLADKPAEMTVYQLPRPTHPTRLVIQACGAVTFSAAKLSEATAARISVLRSAWALPDIVAKHVSGEGIFDAIQALYLSHNTARDRQIAMRLMTLYRVALEEDETIRPASISQFREFFLAHPDLGLPKITLTPDGTLRARWIHGAGDFIALEFTGEQNAKLVAEIPRDNGLTATHFGSEPLPNIVAVAQGMGASFA